MYVTSSPSHFIVSFLTVGTLIGCNGFRAPQAPPFADTESTTGAIREVQDGPGALIPVPYTSAGQNEIFSSLKNELVGKSDTTLAKALKDAEVENLNNKLKPTSGQPSFLQTRLILEFSGTKYQLKFLNAMKIKADGMTSAYKQASNQSAYSLKVDCADRLCQVVTLRLKNPSSKASDSHSSSGNETPYAAALVTKDTPKVRIQPSFIADDLDNSAWRDLHKNYLDKKLTATQQNFSVIDGLSHSTGTISESDSKKVLIRYKSDRLSTKELIHTPEIFEITGDTKDSQGMTIGNNGNSGSMVIQVSQDDSTGTNLPLGRIYLQPGFQDSSTASPIAEYPSSPEQREQNGSTPPKNKKPYDLSNNQDAIIPIPYGTTYPSITSTFDRLEVYRNDPNVKWAIRVWQGTEDDQVCGKPTKHFSRKQAENYFRKVQPLVPYYLAIAQEVDVTPDIAYLSIIESQYATQTGDHYIDGEVNQSGGTAAGAFQILDKTAFGISRVHKVATSNMRISLPVFKVKNKTLNPSDFRYYPTTSFLGASLLMKDNFRVFKKDPALAILAYNQGMGKTAYIQKCAASSSQGSATATSNPAFDQCMKQYTEPLMQAAFKQRHQYFATTLKEVREFGMGASCEELHYVYGWLALKFIGADPKSFGFKVPTEMNLQGLDPLLYYPGKVFPLTPIDPNTLSTPKTYSI